MAKPKRVVVRSGTGPAEAAVATRRPLYLAMLCGLVLLNVAVYAAVRHFELVNWDDSTYVTDNPTVLGGLSWRSAWWALTTGHSPYWHPVTWLSHLLDVTLFGSDAGMYHLTNLVLHVANTLLIFEFFRRTTSDAGRSLFVAAVFAVHPLHVESVAWIAERKDVLSTFFWVLTLLAYLAYVRRPGAGRYTGMLALFGLALMSKPMVVTLPVVLLLLDVWPLGRLHLPGAEQERANARPWVQLVIEKVPLLALALATSAATIVVQSRVGAMANLGALPGQERAAIATIGYVAYLAKTIWPSHLAAFYPLFDISPPRVAAAAIVLIALTLGSIALRKRHPFVVVGWLWYLVTIAPVIGLLQAGEQGMADRFMYVPMLGLLIVVAWGVPVILSRFQLTADARRQGRDRGGRWLLTSAAAAVVLACAVTAHAQVAHWADSVELWSHATRVTPASYIAHENLGQALRERGQFAAAKDSYERAIANAPRRSPGYLAVIHNSLGLVLTRDDQPGAALEHFTTAVQLNPSFAEAQSNLGNALAAAGRLDEAIEHYREAVRLKPDYTEPRVGLGGALLRSAKSRDAIEQYREALRLEANLAEAHNGLGAALATTGQDGEAMSEYTEALRLKPDLPTAHLNVALLLMKKGELAQARRHLETALSIDPGYVPAQQALRAITPAS